jgi:asparagine synthase (glutamine-hydrolysing)
MCGIYGAVSLSGGPLRHPDLLPRMADALRHRGPDGGDAVTAAHAAVGARRLAIMDLTTGDQPFRSPDGNVWMVCNGEIYNAPALRAEHAARGYPFRSRGDIETILPLYECHGADAVAHLEGMFGLAIWDEHRRRLVLARDRAGEKPLFWTLAGGELRFASEIQALLVFPDQPRRLDRAAAELYAALGYVPAPWTMLAGISKLPPAHLLDVVDGRVSARRYWDAAACAAAPSRLAGPGTLRETLLGAVRRELMSDVPLGVFTSGGLDSSWLAAAAKTVLPDERIHTYAVRFTEPGYDESDFAATVARRMGTVHHVVTADDAALLRALDVVTERCAEPIGDPAVLPTYLLADAAREHVKVVLSGEGADELFGGYPTYLGHRAAAWFAALPGPARRALAAAVTRVPASTGKVTVEFLLKRFVAAAAQGPTERHLTWFGCLGPSPAALTVADRLVDGFPTGDPLNRYLWLDFLTYLPDNLLVKVDRATMLASIEARAPFLDRAVLELAIPAPSRIKVRGFRTKAILKDSARGVVPSEVIDRRKRGLSVPVARWLNGPLAGVADRYLTAPRLVARERVAPLLAEHRSGTRNHARALWPLLAAERWAERWNVEIPVP